MNRASLRQTVAECYQRLGPVETAHLVDGIKTIGFRYATRGGMTISVSDIPVPPNKGKMLDEADEQIKRIDEQYQRGLITDDERYSQVVQIWQATTAKVFRRHGAPDGAGVRSPVSAARCG